MLEPAFRVTHLRVCVSRPQTLALHADTGPLKAPALKGDLEPSKLPFSILYESTKGFAEVVRSRVSPDSGRSSANQGLNSEPSGTRLYDKEE